VFLYMRDEYPHVLACFAGKLRRVEGCLGICRCGLYRPAAWRGVLIMRERIAMIESIEGKRAAASSSALVAQVGHFGRPNMVHNVETITAHWVAYFCRRRAPGADSTEKE